jgi:hypothetical protein
MPGMTEGVSLLLTMKTVSIPIHLGPAWYIEHRDTPIEVGDHVEVLGAKAFRAGLPAVIATEVRRGKSVLVLRDAKGIPVWAGWRRGRDRGGAQEHRADGWVTIGTERTYP